MKFRSFEGSIAYFNGMYKLPLAPYPSVRQVIIGEAKRADPQNKELAQYSINEINKWGVTTRLAGLKKTLADEVEEITQIIDNLENGATDEASILTEIADLLGDITIYCASEAQKFGLPMKDILKIIMESNFSKLGEDGQPIYNADGKVMKGPDYWKPEPQIKELILKLRAEQED